jgi:hypothetical protein
MRQRRDFPARFAPLIESAQISVWYSVPTALVHLQERDALRNLRSLRLRQGIPNDAEFGPSAPCGMIESLKPPSRKLFLGEAPRTLDVPRNLSWPAEIHRLFRLLIGPKFATMYCTGQGVPKDLAQAVVWYELAAQLGHRVAQYNLAIMISKGQGCAPDQSKALTYFTHAAEQGLAEAQLVLGEAYRLGRGVEPDQNAARRWYELAARQGKAIKRQARC